MSDNKKYICTEIGMDNTSRGFAVFDEHSFAISDPPIAVCPTLKQAAFLRDKLNASQNTIQAYLSEILKRFDASDKKTWPKNKGKGYFYLVRYKDGTYNYLHFYGENGSIWRGVTHYLDPADILPKEDK